MTGEVTTVTSPAIVKEGNIVKTGNLKKLKVSDSIIALPMVKLVIDICKFEAASLFGFHCTVVPFLKPYHSFRALLLYTHY